GAGAAARRVPAEECGAATGLTGRPRRAGAEATGACRERWAYCKLYAVANALRAPGAPAAELEKEVRQALALAPSLPKLEAFGNKLLAEIKARSAPPVEVKHTPRKGAGWAVAETANFRIVHTQSQETAERVARTAEATRVTMARRWFGEAPAPWSPRCDVYLHANGADYAKATGHPAQSPGHTTISLDKGTGRVVVRRVDLRCDDPNLF